MQVEKFLDCYALELHITSKSDLRQGDLNNPVAMSRGFTFGVCLKSQNLDNLNFYSVMYLNFFVTCWSFY